MSKAVTASIDEQIQAINSRLELGEWALEKRGLPAEWHVSDDMSKRELCRQAVEQLFTLSRSDIENWLARQGLQPEQLAHVRTSEGARDGCYFIREGDRWLFYYQERGGALAGLEFDDLGEARKFLINEWLPASLSALRVTCRTADGTVVRTLYGQ